MNMKKTILSTAVLAVLGVSGLASISTHAAVVNTGDTLKITAGVATYDQYGNVTQVSSGSWFAMDNDGNSKIAGTEKTPLANGTTGLVIGTTTTAGASHSGLPVLGDTNAITAPWAFFGNTGSDYLTVAATGGTTTGINMSGWTVTWAGIPAIPMGTGAWTPLNAAVNGMPTTGYANGKGVFAWDGVYGHTYTLDYTATVPNGDPSGFQNVKYALHLTGVVNAVPVPAAVWLLGSGLLGLVGVARRRKALAAA